MTTHFCLVYFYFKQLDDPFKAAAVEFRTNIRSWCGCNQAASHCHLDDPSQWRMCRRTAARIAIEDARASRWNGKADWARRACTNAHRSSDRGRRDGTVPRHDLPCSCHRWVGPFRPPSDSTRRQSVEIAPPPREAKVTAAETIVDPDQPKTTTTPSSACVSFPILYYCCSFPTTTTTTISSFSLL